jgi:hypothetical protein
VQGSVEFGDKREIEAHNTVVFRQSPLSFLIVLSRDNLLLDQQRDVIAVFRLDVFSRFEDKVENLKWSTLL